MPIQTDGSAADHMVVRATGKLTKEDIIQFSKDFDLFVTDRGRLRVLFDVTELEGWGSGAALWQEVKFDFKHLSNIDRLATVGAKKWQLALETAIKPFAHPTMRDFGASDMQAAHDWLVSK
ncbi:MAG TPA: STAS/SEC14 domain-containing protein [Terracidiphilus sp.]